MGKLSRDKGKVGEREFSRLLNSYGIEARRIAQVRLDEDAYDVESKGFVIPKWEVKRRQRLNIHDTVKEVKEMSPDDYVAVGWRRDKGKWIIAMDADDFLNLITGLTQDVLLLEQANGS